MEAAEPITPSPSKKKEFQVLIEKDNCILSFIYSGEQIKFMIKSENDTSFKFEKNLSFEQLNKISKWFKIFDSLDEVYEDIIKLMENKQIKINKEENSVNLIFIINMEKIKEFNITLEQKELSKDEIINNLVKENKELKIKVNNLEKLLNLHEERLNLLEKKLLNKKENNTIDEESLKKLKKVEEELSKVKSKLEQKSKLCLEQKHKIDELTGEYNNLKSEKDNLQDLVNFYEAVEVEKPDEIKELDNNDLFSSDIIDGEDKKTLNNWINSNNNKKIKLLYKASRDGDSYKDFYRLCESKGPTVTVVLTTKGYKFGGFTKLSWKNPTNGAGNNKYYKDKEAFLFSLNKKKILSKFKHANEFCLHVE